MNPMYMKIDGDKYRRVFVVGDLHGCYKKLTEQLKKVSFDPKKDLIISVGDLIDRGEDSLKCLSLLNTNWFKSVLGNHEKMMVDSLDCVMDTYHWINNGGSWFFRLDWEEQNQARCLVEFIRKLPLVIEVTKNNKKFVIAHADYPSNVYEYGKDINKEDVIWNRDRFDYVVSEGEETRIKGADMFFFGHSPVDKVLTKGNVTYLDTGAVFGWALSMIELGK